MVAAVAGPGGCPGPSPMRTGRPGGSWASRSVPTRARDRGRQHPGCQPASRRGDPQEQAAGEPGTAMAEQPQAGRGAFAERRHQQGRSPPGAPAGSSCRRSRRSIKPCKPSLRRESALGSSPKRIGPSRASRSERGAGRPRPELLRHSPVARAVVPQRGPARVRPPFVGPDPEASHGGFLEAGPPRQSRAHLCRPDYRGTRHQTGRVQASAVPPRTRCGQARPPLLRRRQRDRRRGHAPKRQSWKQCPGWSEPDGGPLADGDLGRRQLQGDPARRA